MYRKGPHCLFICSFNLGFRPFVDHLESSRIKEIYYQIPELDNQLPCTRRRLKFKCLLIYFQIINVVPNRVKCNSCNTSLLISSWGHGPKFIYHMKLKMLIFNPMLEKGIYKKPVPGIRNSRDPLILLMFTSKSVVWIILSLWKI